MTGSITSDRTVDLVELITGGTPVSLSNQGLDIPEGVSLSFDDETGLLTIVNTDAITALAAVLLFRINLSGGGTVDCEVHADFAAVGGGGGNGGGGNAPTVIDPDAIGLYMGLGGAQQVINYSGEPSSYSYYDFTLSNFISGATSYTVSTVDPSGYLLSASITNGVLHIEWGPGEMPYANFHVSIEATNANGSISVTFEVVNA